MKQILIAAALFVIPTAASAQDSRDIRVRVGGGVQLQPRYPGADKDKLGPLVKVSIARGTEPFKFTAPDDAAAIPIVKSGPFAFGPAANYVGSRKDSDIGAPLGKVKATIEAGAFASYRLSDAIRIRGEVLKGINGHKGVVGQLGVDRIWRDGDRYVFSIGPRLMFSDARYQRAYFGVTPAASLASGLPAYRPGGGIHGVALATGMTTQLNDRFGLFSFARYERLIGDAAKSPVIRQLGSRNQVAAGLGLNYVFTVRR